MQKKNALRRTEKILPSVMLTVTGRLQGARTTICIVFNARLQICERTFARSAVVVRIIANARLQLYEQNLADCERTLLVQIKLGGKVAF